MSEHDVVFIQDRIYTVAGFNTEVGSNKQGYSIIESPKKKHCQDKKKMIIKFT